jgi:hypothetical protein
MPDLTADIERVSADIVIRLQNAGIIGSSAWAMYRAVAAFPVSHYLSIA